MLRPALLSLLLALVAVGPAAAQGPALPLRGPPSAIEFSTRLLPEREGVVPWRTLGAVEYVRKDGRIVTEFAPGTLALDGREVKLQGFMIPLAAASGRQTRFLLSAVPPHCQFCLPAGPEAVVEVTATEGVTFTLEPVMVTGRFEVVKGHQETGIFYRLSRATGIAAVRTGEPRQSTPR